MTGRLILGLLVAAALWLGYSAWADHQQGIGEARATSAYNAAIEKQKAKARELLAAETAKVRQAEDALRKFKDQQEIKDGKNKNVVAALERRLRDAAGAGQLLHDPNAAARCGGGGGAAKAPAGAGAGDRAADAAQAGGLLSAPLTRLLAELTREADEINVAYTSCRADVQAVRAACAPPPE